MSVMPEITLLFWVKQNLKKKTCWRLWPSPSSVSCDHWNKLAAFGSANRLSFIKSGSSTNLKGAGSSMRPFPSSAEIHCEADGASRERRINEPNLQAFHSFCNSWGAARVKSNTTRRQNALGLTDKQSWLLNGTWDFRIKAKYSKSKIQFNLTQ